ncbi:hypothetical protein BDM02DRAFT_3119986 [Thelephora ganbajun]|uniref:Uncharacterized protein n=1 Tax=Thelephora ganbajun TaxID=370292 RepID=A0ACB6Z7K4_THEGA|nr:hypothetical protein BDM02DRAFT_3119986 [Thelephora ganbajun]
MGSGNLAALLSRAGSNASPLPPTTQSDILAILQQEQDQALSLLSLSPLLSSLFISYANRAAIRGSASTTPSSEAEECKALQDAITSLREENEKLKMETREMIRKLEISEASQEMLRSQISSLSEANAAQRDDTESLRAELVEAKGNYDRFVADSDAEKAALKVQISGLETQRGQLRDTAVKQQIRISKLERPMVDSILPPRGPTSPSLLYGDSISTPSLPDSPISPLRTSLPTIPTPYVNGRLMCVSPPTSPGPAVSLRPHPMARGGLVPGRHKSSTMDMRSDAASSAWFADGD